MTQDKKVSSESFIAEINKLSEQIHSQNSELYWGNPLASKSRFLPGYLSSLEHIVQHNEVKLPKLSKIKSFVSLMKAIVLETYHTLFAQTFYLFKKSEFPKNAVVIKTFSYTHNFKENGFADPFFPNLHSTIEKSEKSVITVMDPIHCFKQTLSKTNTKNFVSIYYFSKISDVFFALKKTVQSKSLKVSHLKFFNHDVTKLINYLLKFYATDHRTFLSWMYYRKFERLFKKISVENYIYSFENNNWELMGLLAIQKISPNTKVKAYQHSVVPESAVNFFHEQSLSSLLPKTILTTGKTPREAMLKYSHFTKTELVPSCALKFQYLYTRKEKIYNKNKRLLVALEGVAEAVDFFRYVILQALVSDWTFLIRFHPSFGLKEFIKILEISIHDLPKNIEISSAVSLQDDIKVSDAVLYWGSAVGLEAGAQGLIPINFNIGAVLNFDPLFTYKGRRWHAPKGSTLQKVLEEIHQLSLKERENIHEEFLKFIKEYFYTCEQSNLQAFLN